MIARFFRWLLCPCRSVDRQRTEGPWPGWSRTECCVCGRKWSHFRDGAWRI